MKKKDSTQEVHMGVKQRELNEYRRLFGRLFVVLGLALMVSALGIWGVDYNRGMRAKAIFEKAKQEQLWEEESPAEDSFITEGGIVQVNATKSTTLTEGVLGILRIPVIDLEEAIMEGESSNVLSSALGHMTDTAMPGAEGNCAIAGHRNYVFGRFFNRLDELTVGDQIEIETLDGSYVYTVTESFVVEPEEVSVLEPTGEPSLTLITCTPLFVGSHRLIIRAVLE